MGVQFHGRPAGSGGVIDFLLAVLDPAGVLGQGDQFLAVGAGRGVEAEQLGEFVPVDKVVVAPAEQPAVGLPKLVVFVRIGLGQLG